jgi:hypothetical protein
MPVWQASYAEIRLFPMTDYVGALFVGGCDFRATRRGLPPSLRRLNCRLDELDVADELTVVPAHARRCDHRSQRKTPGSFLPGVLLDSP